MTGLSDLWKKTRNGAWASRGFRFQDAVAAHLLIGMWAGVYKPHLLTPEGFDDIELSAESTCFVIQIKSKAATSRPFSGPEIERFKSSLNDRAAQLGLAPSQSALILERVSDDLGVRPWAEFDFDQSDNRNQYQFSDVESSSVALVSSKLGCFPSVAEIVVQSIVRFVGVLVDANAAASLADRISASVSDVDELIANTVRSIDPSSLEAALYSRLCEPVDFANSLPSENFYKGEDVQPGHISAGLVFDRPEDVERTRSTLLNRRAVLISGPSGAGKSALQWLTANALRHGVRWYRVNSATTVSDLNTLRDFVSGLQPSLSAPVGFVMDDVGREQADLWLALERALLSSPGLLLLGSIREEDVQLVRQSANHALLSVCLDEKLAETLWRRLCDSGESDWPHWREPYEKASGLLLEYVHILTQGERLERLISGQIARREQEGRLDELALLRLASCAALGGASISPVRLADALNISSDRFRSACRRLIDEHLLRASENGRVSGLHELRSKAILAATHDIGLETIQMSAAATLDVIEADDIPRYLIRCVEDFGVSDLQAACILVDRFENSGELLVIAQSFAAFGFLTLHDLARDWTSVLQDVGLEPAHWMITTMLANAGRRLPEADQDIQTLSRINAAIERFESIQTEDRRLVLAEALAARDLVLELKDGLIADKLLSNFAPMSRLPAVPIDALAINFDVEAASEELFTLLETARAVEPTLAVQMVQSLGGTAYALDCAFAFTPWISHPVIKVTENSILSVAAEYYCIDEDPTSSLNDEIVSVCRKLLAVAPEAERVDVRAVTSTGDEIAWPGFGPLSSQSMPRENLPADAIVRWNQVFSQIVIGRGAAPSETQFAQEASQLLKKTAVLLEKAEKAFSRDKVRNLKQADLDALYEVSRRANEYSTESPIAPSGEHKPSTDGVGAHHPAPTLVAAICGGLLPRTLRYDVSSPDRGVASSAAQQLRQVKAVRESPLWRLVSDPPYQAIESISASLYRMYSVLSELVHSPVTFLNCLERSKRYMPSKAPSALAKCCKRSADARFDAARKRLAEHLRQNGLGAEIIALPLQSEESDLWPPLRLCALVDSSGLLDFLSKMDGIDFSESEIPADRHLVLLPRRLGVVVPQFGLSLREQNIFPAIDGDIVGLREAGFKVLEDEWVDLFQIAASSAIRLSSIASCRELDRLHKIEAAAFDEAKQTFHDAIARFLQAQDELDDERFSDAADVLRAMEAAQAGEEWATAQFDGIENIGADLLHGEISSATSMLVYARSQLIEWAVSRLRDSKAG